MRFLLLFVLFLASGCGSYPGASLHIVTMLLHENSCQLEVPPALTLTISDVVSEKTQVLSIDGAPLYYYPGRASVEYEQGDCVAIYK